MGARGGGCHEGEFSGATGVGRGWGRAGGDPPQLELQQLFIVQFLSSHVGWYVEVVQRSEVRGNQKYHVNQADTVGGAMDKIGW